MLRLDCEGGAAPGNKQFKLKPFIAQAQAEGAQRLVSFGGVWSNHLHALAAVGFEQGIATVGIVRGSPQETHTAALLDARRWGMAIEPVGRAQYRQRNDAAYQATLVQRYAPCLLIPEGGGSAVGASACAEIAAHIVSSSCAARRIVLPVGTGTTLAGIVAALPPDYEVVGISALKGAKDLSSRVEQLLKQLGARNHARWQILHEHHCGGFARLSAPLKEFILAFEQVQKKQIAEQPELQLDPVYTAKMLFAVFNLQVSGQWNAQEPVLAIHTGGLQGRRGFSLMP